MSNLTIAYNGIAIFDGELEGAVTLPTAEKYLEGDIVIAEPEPTISSVLENNEWSVISEVSQAGEGPNYWSIGDTKSILLRGICGTLSLNTTLYCYILGFDHNSGLEGTGIQFGTWKSAATNGVDVCIVDSFYDTGIINGTHSFNMNHWGTGQSSGNYDNGNVGGWKGCDLRYDVLGSTDEAPQSYGSMASAQLLATRFGFDASSKTATNPVSNTLMSCLPSELRNVMKPITKYTWNNLNASNSSNYVTSSIDYLPLLAEYEVWGVRSNANTYEKDYQTQYTYYSIGNSKQKYRHDVPTTKAIWWERSPAYGPSYGYFCVINASVSEVATYSKYSFGLAPVFMV